MKKPAEQSVSTAEGEIRIIREEWFNLILFVEEHIPHGDIKIKVIDGVPRKLLDVKQDIRFDQPDSIPKRFKPEFVKNER